MKKRFPLETYASQLIKILLFICIYFQIQIVEYDMIYLTATALHPVAVEQ
jgi:hypothetical protein